MFKSFLTRSNSDRICYRSSRLNLNININILKYTLACNYLQKAKSFFVLLLDTKNALQKSGNKKKLSYLNIDAVCLFSVFVIFSTSSNIFLFFSGTYRHDLDIRSDVKRSGQSRSPPVISVHRFIRS